ncbi:Prp18-domain-containing protein [Linderina pennispora]|uniref:Pre-mRNA-splicing factor 18 n=1 Tax=Linderina pennispora TaxID=61395 RepID=A0A1Y1WF11_9FUNG|nr:Prp18-domain-containing protein [Linderina pennispora]ORX71826.1 Prp18-domain-containing protein [Linderina pennispora]
MDALRAAISSETKKRKQQFDKVAAKNAERSGEKRKKYVRASELAEEEYRQNGGAPARPVPSFAPQEVPADTKNEDVPVVAEADEPKVSSAIKQRGGDQAATRLRNLELHEEKLDGQGNEFRRMLAQVEEGAMMADLKRQAKMQDDEEERRRAQYAQLKEYDTDKVSLELLRTDAEQLNTLLHAYFKRTLYEWEDYLANRPEDEQRSTEGKLAAATMRQSADYLKPFFSGLKLGKLEADVVARVTEIARNMMDREYMKAQDAYLQLSIGNAPWPVGVTQVGIHARAARENISASKVAHVLNDETQRKWIQSIKRLMRFAQTKYPPDDLAKMVG